MQHNQSVTNEPVQVPPIVWFLGLGLAVALVAIFVFNVPLTSVGYYAFFAFFIGSHFFMHGSHGGHDNHGSSTPPPETSTNIDGPAREVRANSEDEHAGHSGGCH